MDLSIKLFIADIDGVMTDGGVYYSESGDKLKKFSFYDTMGFKILHNNGIKTAMICSDASTVVSTLAEELKVDFLHQDSEDKYETAREICEEAGLELSEVAYIGDDVNDEKLIKNVGLAACPANATTTVKEMTDILVLKRSGGHGAVREMIDYILENGFGG